METAQMISLNEFISGLHQTVYSDYMYNQNGTIKEFVADIAAEAFSGIDMKQREYFATSANWDRERTKSRKRLEEQGSEAPSDDEIYVDYILRDVIADFDDILNFFAYSTLSDAGIEEISGDAVDRIDAICEQYNAESNDSIESFKERVRDAIEE